MRETRKGPVNEAESDEGQFFRSGGMKSVRALYDQLP